MRRSALIATTMLIASPALAAHWNVDPVTSKLNFEGDQSGEKFQGCFPKFTSDIDFDEAAPSKGSIHISIDMSKLQIDGKDRMDALPSDDWFAVAKFPSAEFTSTSIRADPVEKTGIRNYTAKGKLTLRGIAREIELPFALKTEGTSTVARGNITLSRKDFGVGGGRWASEEWVKYPVQVTFEIHANVK